MKLTQYEFERVVGDALASLPKRFTDLIKNVVIAIEDEPTDEDLACDADEPDHDFEILGIYRGVPLTDPALDDIPLFPDKIADAHP